MEVERNPVPLIRINAPDLYAEPMFREWLNRVSTPNCAGYRGFPTATWHVSGELPGELSDVFMVVDGADGSDSDMPAMCWRRLHGALQNAMKGEYTECVVWLTNVSED